MIEIKLTKKIVEQCKSKAKDMGKLNNSITKGQGNLAGIVGEYIVHKYLKNSEWKNTYSYDLIHENKKIDVKTKRCNSKPLPTYDCSVAETSLHQLPDEYIFVRVLNNFSMAWILGRISHKTYFSKAKKLLKGQVDPANNFTVRANCYNLRINELDKI
jgi:hypothetical protein|tara:strand:- start:1705 stop:2178 length:474 start_codon:yes stop_codon:yes gene_type:complete